MIKEEFNLIHTIPRIVEKGLMKWNGMALPSIIKSYPIPKLHYVAYRYGSSLHTLVEK